MITKRVELGLVSILPNGVLQIREETVIEEAGIELSRTYHRLVLTPSSTTMLVTHPRVKAIADLIWTPAVVAAYAAERAAQKPFGVPPPPA